MKIHNLLALASLLISAAIGAVGYVLVPLAYWTIASIGSYLLLVGTVGLMFHPTFGLPNATKSSDAAVMAGIGPVGFYFLMLLIWNMATFFFGIYGYDKVSYAMMIISAVSLPLLMIYVKIGAHIVNKGANQMRADMCRVNWIASIEMCARMQVLPEVAKKLLEMAEDLRFSSSSIEDVSSMQDQNISMYVAELTSKNETLDLETLEYFLSKIRQQLALRESILLSSRIKR